MSFFSPMLLRAGAVLLFVVGLLTACTVVVEDDSRPIGPGPAIGQMCPRNYDPVCARRGGDRQTFSNACMADRAGYRIVSGGECQRGGRNPRICTREYAPVCARRGGNVRSFGNSCEADAAGYRILRYGPC